MIWLLILSALLGAVAVLFAELLRTRGVIGNETTRKVFHISHALVVICWVFLTSYHVIILIEAVCLGVVLLARIFKLFQPLRAVRRLSWGEFFFPLAVIVLAAFSPPRWVFLSAVLHFGLADSAAALMGQYAKGGHYKVFGHTKTLLGSFAFWFVSAAITLLIFSFSGSYDATPVLPAVLLLPLLITLTENLSPFGSDNFTVPIVSGVLFWLLIS